MSARERKLKGLLRLNAVPGIGPNKLRNLVGYFKSPSSVFTASEIDLTKVPGVDKKLAHNIRSFDGTRFVDAQLAALEKAGTHIVTYWDKAYPELLKQIYDPPCMLFVKGKLRSCDKAAIAIVGSRQPSTYGKMVAEKLAADLVHAGLTVVSGLAYGIDTAAHQHALNAPGRTIAVLGSGVDVIYPARNQSLANAIVESGAVVSEYSMGTMPDRANFPRRNRIICGLSLGVIVVEAGQKSGALITASMALEQNREVFAVPGNINNSKSFGPNTLLKEGATVVTSVEDVVEVLSPFLPSRPRNKGSEQLNIDLSGDLRAIMEILSHEPTHVDRITNLTKQSTPSVLGHLLTLELKNLVKQLPGKRYVKA